MKGANRELHQGIKSMKGIHTGPTTNTWIMWMRDLPMKKMQMRSQKVGEEWTVRKVRREEKVAKKDHVEVKHKITTLIKLQEAIIKNRSKD